MIALKKVYLWFFAIYLKLNQFKKILVTIDGSRQSMKAVDYAINIAQKYDSELIALHVLYSQIGFAFYSETATGLVTPNSINELIEQAKKEAVITAISVVEAIISYSEKENIDLIVIGSRGRSAFRKLILGSAASGVMTFAHCPVMVIK